MSGALPCRANLRRSSDKMGSNEKLGSSDKLGSCDKGSKPSEETTLGANRLCVLCSSRSVLTDGHDIHGCGSKPMVPFWGRCTAHFSLL